MRELKFRAWDIVMRRMYSPKQLATLVIASNVPDWADLGTPTVRLMQYTGLKDKNGKEIYEGDIVSMPFNRYPQNWRVGELSAYGLSFERITIKPYSAPYHYRELRHTEQLEVIGNIYENPELLEVKNVSAKITR